MRRWTALLLVVGCNGEIVPPPDPVCQTLLECAPLTEVACSAPETVVDVPDAARCDRAVVTDDRLATYPVGESSVTFEARLDHPGFTRTATCTSRVTVFDDVPPEVTCERSITLARSAPDAPWPEVPVGTATDSCDADVQIAVEPAELTERLTDVVTSATDASGNVETCTTAVEVLDVFAVDDFRLLGAVLDDADDTVLTLGWGSSTDDVDTVEVQRADGPDGPWTAVESHAVDEHLAVLSQRSGSWYRLLSVAEGLPGGTTEPIPVHAVGRDAYDIRNVAVPRIPFSTTLYGVVRFPTDLDDGPYPLVLLMHGNHGNCRRDGTLDDYCATTRDHECNYEGYSTTPNAEGLAYLAETLAARGMIAATVSANAMNCRGGYILERAQLLRSHLEAWADWDAGNPGPSGRRFAGRVDLSHVGLVGHSRGGDAVSHVPQALADDPIPGVDVVSIHAIAPTDYNDATVFDSSWSLLLAACDGDVSNLWGADIYERSDETVWHKNQVFFPGANHNFFNTEWAFDDGRRACGGGDRVGWQPQVTMAMATIGPWMSRTLDDDEPEATQRAEVPSPSSLDRWAGRPVDLRWSYTTADATLVDAFADSLDTNELSGRNDFVGFEATSPCFGSGCGDNFLHPTSAVRLTWGSGDEARASFGLGGLGTAEYGSLSFRVASNVSTRNLGLTEQVLQVQVTDASGSTATVDVAPVPHLYGAYDIREVLQTVRVPFATLEVANPALDVERIEQISVDLGGDDASGSVTVTDIELGY